MGKIDDLKKEIVLLKERNAKVSEYRQLKSERNKLKYAKLYSIAEKLKNTSKNIGIAMKKRAESQKNKPTVITEKVKVRRTRYTQPQNEMDWVMRM